MDVPWCPKGCDVKYVEGKFYMYMLKKFPKIAEEGVHEAECPVCRNKIEIHTTLVPDYECRKGKGWKE